MFEPGSFKWANYLPKTPSKPIQETTHSCLNGLFLLLCCYFAIGPLGQAIYYNWQAQNDLKIFQQAQKEIESRLYKQSYDWPIWKIVTLGNYKKISDLEKTLISNGYRIDYVRSLLDKIDLSSGEAGANLIRLTVSELGFPDGAHYPQIRAKANELGLEFCPAEIGPQLRNLYHDQPRGEVLFIAMDPITVYGDTSIFCLEYESDGLWLKICSAHPGGGWEPEDKFIFTLRE